MRKLLLVLGTCCVVWLQACNQQDIVLVNEIKALDAKWIRSSEQVTEMYKILPKWREIMAEAETGIREIEGQNEEWMDSVVGIQKSILKTFDSTARDFEAFRRGFQEEVKKFGDWQQEAVKQSGKDPEKTRTDLSLFQESYESEKKKSDALKKRILEGVEAHNTHRNHLLTVSEWLQVDAIQVR